MNLTIPKCDLCGWSLHPALLLDSTVYECHNPNCEKGKAMSTSTPEELIAIVRAKFRERNEHHWNCSARNGLKCDCYASRDTEAHDALDKLADTIREAELRGRIAEAEACLSIAEKAWQEPLSKSFGATLVESKINERIAALRKEGE